MFSVWLEENACQVLAKTLKPAVREEEMARSACFPLHHLASALLPISAVQRTAAKRTASPGFAGGPSTPV